MKTPRILRSYIFDTSGVEINPAKEETLADVLSTVEGLASFTPSAYDFIAYGYTGNNMTSIIYKIGGASGTIVCTLTLAYSGNNLISITKS